MLPLTGKDHNDAVLLGASILMTHQTQVDQAMQKTDADYANGLLSGREYHARMCEHHTQMDRITGAIDVLMRSMVSEKE